MSVTTKQYIVITNKNKVVAETLSSSKKRALDRYRDKWLRFSENPSQEWTRRRRRGYRVAAVELSEI